MNHECKAMVQPKLKGRHKTTDSMSKLLQPPRPVKLPDGRRWALGQSMLETVIALALLAILCGLAVSSWRPLRQALELEMLAEDLWTSVLTARSEAMRRQQRVTVCISSDGLACAAAGSWQQGWLMFQDSNGNGAVDPGERVLQIHGALPIHFSATGNSTVSKYISYGSSGRSLSLTGAFQAGTVSLCPFSASTVTGWRLVLNAAGKPRLEKTVMSNCK